MDLTYSLGGFKQPMEADFYIIAFLLIVLTFLISYYIGYSKGYKGGYKQGIDEQTRSVKRLEMFIRESRQKNNVRV